MHEYWNQVELAVDDREALLRLRDEIDAARPPDLCELERMLLASRATQYLLDWGKADVEPTGH